MGMVIRHTGAVVRPKAGVYDDSDRTGSAAFGNERRSHRYGSCI